MVRGERVDVAFPPEFRAGAELAAVQQNDRITVAGLEIPGDEPVDDDRGSLHLIAIGLMGDPTAPVTRNGGATSWNS